MAGTRGDGGTGFGRHDPTAGGVVPGVLSARPPVTCCSHWLLKQAHVRSAWEFFRDEMQSGRAMGAGITSGYWPEAVIERDELCLWGHRKSAIAAALQGRDGCRLGSRLSGAVVVPQHPPNQLLHHDPGH